MSAYYNVMKDEFRDTCANLEMKCSVCQEKFALKEAYIKGRFDCPACEARLVIGVQAAFRKKT